MNTAYFNLDGFDLSVKRYKYAHQRERETDRQTDRQTETERERDITIILTTSGRSSPRLVFLQEKLSSPTTITTIGLPKVSLAYLKMSVQDLSFA